MPPRMNPFRLSTPTSCQCFRTRPKPLPFEPATHNYRSFHATPRNATRLRRNMWAWLNGPGRAFQKPLPGSTNYLGAYDKFGNLLRMQDRDRGGWIDRKAQKQDNFEENEAEKGGKSQLKIDEEEVGLDEFERDQRAKQRQVNRQEAEAEREKAESSKRNGLPKERMSDLRPYPLNKNFRSQAVLSEELREELYTQVVERRFDITSVSAVFGVEIRRVAAVVRLKTIEKQWVKDGRKLATPYTTALLAMLPTTPYTPGADIAPHEPINDLPVHPATRQQIFYPTSESRHFTRADAAKVFSPNLLPADERIPHPELIQIARWEIEGKGKVERRALMVEKDREDAARRDEAARRKRVWEENTQRVVQGRRWEFKFQDISAERTGKTGRDPRGVGVRYGMPHEERKRGIVKIPARVE